MNTDLKKGVGKTVKVAGMESTYFKIRVLSARKKIGLSTLKALTGIHVICSTKLIVLHIATIPLLALMLTYSK